MAASPPKTKTARPKQKAGRKPRLTNAELLRLARKHRPPQSWYDEGVNPFEPQR